MATIVETSVNQLGDFAATVTTLTAADTFTYKSNANQILILRNGTAGALTATIDGDGATTITPDGYGGAISVSGGKAITVAAGATKAVRLDTIKAFLTGTISVTGGTGLEATLLAAI